jgi:excisionase family DNA binding protein
MIKFPDEELLRPDELAKMFKVSKQVIYLWIETGELEAVRIGKKALRVKKRDAMKMVKPAIE